ncbi:hypothetical protein EGT74_16740 [Chitinophaga lutea]|uniref:Signal transduction histidine kinase internal region domain-containing protein n=1 Tax=Chitinophaga lutea TaxID=2488634 RepID=A0A3N4QAB8_9BACT|nr:histidine kinase [Chitinophaga lutea]RPE08684.1 hypothetical protein EGT74_16740 [Chitinophaga lutea]
MKRSTNISIHVCVWALLFIPALPKLYRWYEAGRWIDIWDHVFFFTTLAATFYYCYILAWPRFNVPGKRWQCPVLLFFTFTVYWVLLLGLHQLTWLSGRPPLIRNLDEAMAAANDSPLHALVFSGIIWGLGEARRRFRENRRLQKENQQVEMDFLRMQFNPHFLFNMLNNLHYSAAKVSEPLAEHVERIANLMSYSIMVSRDGLVELETELAHIGNYVELFRMRFEPKFHVNVEVSGEMDNMRIPPLLLLPFVENAFKHGVVNNPESPVSIRVNVTGNKLEFSVRNGIGHHCKDTTRGIGLPGIRRRLQLIYPGRHSLHISSEQDVYLAQLHINL